MDSLSFLPQTVGEEEGLTKNVCWRFAGGHETSAAVGKLIVDGKNEA
jgi:hypothetical protein